MGRAAEAIESFERALKLEPIQPLALFGKGRAQAGLGRNDGAIATLERFLLVARPDELLEQAQAARGLIEECRKRLGAQVVAPAEQPPASPAGDLLSKGFLLLPLARFEQALACFEGVLCAEPTDAAALDGKGAALAGLAKTEEAFAAFEAAIQADPRRAWTYCRRADLLRKGGDAARALADYERAIGIDATCLAAHYGRGHCLMALGRLKEAVEAFEPVRVQKQPEAAMLAHRAGLCLDPKAHTQPIDPQKANAFQRGQICSARYLVYYWLGQCQDMLERYNSAVSSFKSFLMAPPAGYDSEVEDAKRRLPALEAFGAAFPLYKEKRDEEFVAVIKKALVLDPSRVQVRRTLGLALSRLGRYPEALDAYDQILAQHPRNIRVLDNKGALLGKMERYEEAIAVMDRVLALDPKEEAAWQNKAVCLGKLGRRQELLAFIEETLAHEPEREMAWWRKAHVHLDAGETAQAIECFRKFLENIKPATSIYDVDDARRKLWRLEKPGEPLVPERAAGLLHESLAAMLGGRAADALALLERAVAADALNVNAWTNQAAALALLGRHRDALACHVRACELQPNNAGHWLSRATALMGLRCFEEAEPCWERLTRWWPQEPDHWVRRSRCCRRLGRHEEALRHVEEALARRPGHWEAALDRAWLLGKAGRTDEALAAARAILEDKAVIGELAKKDAEEIAHWAGADANPAFAELVRQAMPAPKPASAGKGSPSPPRPAQIEGIGLGAPALLEQLRKLGLSDQLQIRIVGGETAPPSKPAASVQTAEQWKAQGDAHLARGDRPAAMRCYKTAVEKDRRFVDAWIGLGICYAKARETEQAAAAFDKALECKPGHPAATKEKAKMLLAANRAGSAIEALEGLLTRDASDSEAAALLQECRRRLGRR